MEIQTHKVSKPTRLFYRKHAQKFWKSDVFWFFLKSAPRTQLGSGTNVDIFIDVKNKEIVGAKNQI